MIRLNINNSLKPKLPPIFSKLVALTAIFFLQTPLADGQSPALDTTPSSDSSSLPETISIEGKTLKALLTKAEELTNQNKTELAFELYTKIMTDSTLIEQIHMPSFHYNLALTAAKAQKNGLAVAYLSKALTSNPFDIDARFNLGVMRDRLNNGAGYGERYFSLSFLSPLLTHSPPGILLFLCSALLCILLLNALMFRKRWLFSLSLFWLLPVAFLTAYTFIENHDDIAVVIASSPVLRSGPSDSFPEILKIGEGSEVAILEKRKNWYKIEFALATNREEAIVGWVHEKNLLSI